MAMASFASQLVDMLYGIVERVTGCSARPEDDKDAKPKLATTKAFVTEEVVEVRSRSHPESGGSGAEVNLVGI
uniref:Uncharacterized protein n=1 Tax=Avena sativa TaxID=4498 RepID=A0ACD5UFH6_AVESA